MLAEAGRLDEKHVVGLHVAVDDADAVQMGERRGDLMRDGEAELRVQAERTRHVPAHARLDHEALQRAAATVLEHCAHVCRVLRHVKDVGDALVEGGLEPAQHVQLVLHRRRQVLVARLQIPVLVEGLDRHVALAAKVLRPRDLREGAVGDGAHRLVAKLEQRIHAALSCTWRAGLRLRPCSRLHPRRFGLDGGVDCSLCAAQSRDVNQLGCRGGGGETVQAAGVQTAGGGGSGERGRRA